MAEIRTTSSTGGQKGVKAERHDLIPRKGTAAVARVFGFGALKYADHNWRNRYEWGKSLAAMQRHIDAFADGETYDLCPGEPEDCEKWSNEHKRCLEHSGEHHLAQAGFHMLTLITWVEEDGEGPDNPMDDRWPAALERARRAEALTSGPDVRWDTPETLTVAALDVSLETIALATGQSVDDLRQCLDNYSIPKLFIAGMDEPSTDLGAEGNLNI